MPRFPVDAPREKVTQALALVRAKSDGSRTPLTLPNHKVIKGSTLRTVLTQSGISRDEFLAAYEQV